MGFDALLFARAIKHPAACNPQIPDLFRLPNQSRVAGDFRQSLSNKTLTLLVCPPVDKMARGRTSNMGASPHVGPLGYDAVRDLKWSPAEKAIARKDFDLALHRELEAVMIEAKKKADKIQQPSDLWDFERYLTERRTQIDRQFAYRYYVLILVFGDLMRQGRLSEQELQGLSEDKLNSIRRYAKPLDFDPRKQA